MSPTHASTSHLLMVTGALFALFASGCKGDSGAVGVTPPAAVGMLRLVNNAAELEAALKSAVRAAPSADVLATAAPNAPGQFSGTYTLESRVDELDTVRYDGRLIYIAPQRVFHCCVIADPLAAPVGPPLPTPQQAIRILRTETANATATPVGRIELGEGVSVQGLYVADNRVIALTSEAYFGSFGAFWEGLPYWAPSQFGIRIYDVTDPGASRTLFSAQLDGVYVDSRRVGDNIYIVSRYAPRILLDSSSRASVQSTPLDRLLPQVTVNGVSRSLVDAARCFITSDDSDNASAVLTSITVIPVQNPASFTTTCYNEEAYGVYVSEQSIYLTQFRSRVSPGPVTTNDSQARTRVHRFDIAGGPVAYRGSVEIDGFAWTGGQADFRLSEFNGALRIMTTEFVSDATDNVEHRLFVLRAHASRPELEIVSQLPNDRRPEEIGKPNEQLFGVRFVGTRAYAVTFQRIDPLYVIDLSDSSDPKISGSLELPGFSDFLHPVTEALLLGLGQAPAGGVKLALFDVSQAQQPREIGGLTFGGRGTSSEAQWDRHAFTWLPDVAGVDRFTIPINQFSTDDQYRFVDSSLVLLEIRDKTSPDLASLNVVGRMVSRTADAQPATGPTSRSRSFIHDNAVYYIADEEVRGALWHSPTLLNGPF